MSNCKGSKRKHTRVTKEPADEPHDGIDCKGSQKDLNWNECVL